MKQRAFLGILVVGTIFAAAACGGSGNTGSGGSGGGGGTDTTSSSGTTSSSTTSSSSSTSTSSSSSSSTTSSSSSGGGTPADHLLISEVGVQPVGGEFVEIYNAGTTSVDLGNYYLSDNSGYHRIATGMPWDPVTSNPGTDFLAQFPAGTTLAPGATIVIAVSDPATFEMHYTKCPDFVLSTTAYTCTSTSGTAKAMVAPTNGEIGDKAGLSNDREMVVLFTWDGSSPTVKDVDYVTWGTTYDDATRADKTGVTGYQADTPRANQKPAAAPALFNSIERCTLETGEALSGGNGLTGHDETSEPLDTTFVVQAAPTPGTKNACLP